MLPYANDIIVHLCNVATNKTQPRDNGTAGMVHTASSSTAAPKERGTGSPGKSPSIVTLWTGPPRDAVSNLNPTCTVEILESANIMGTSS